MIWGLGENYKTISFLTSVAKETKILILARLVSFTTGNKNFPEFAPQMESGSRLRSQAAPRWTHHNQSTGGYHWLRFFFHPRCGEYQKNQYEYLILDKPRSWKIPKPSCNTYVALRFRMCLPLSGTPIMVNSSPSVVLPGLFPAKKTQKWSSWDHCAIW